VFGSSACPNSLLVLVIILIIFGAGKLPEIGSGIGKAIKNFKGGSRRGREGEKGTGEKIEGDKKS